MDDQHTQHDIEDKQPLLDRDTDFKFYEQRNLGIYTTKQAFEGGSILYVYHNEDGTWQFHSSLEPKIADPKLVCLKEITKLDPSINEIIICNMDGEHGELIKKMNGNM